MLGSLLSTAKSFSSRSSNSLLLALSAAAITLGVVHEKKSSRFQVPEKEQAQDIITTTSNKASYSNHLKLSPIASAFSPNVTNTSSWISTQPVNYFDPIFSNLFIPAVCIFPLTKLIGSSWHRNLNRFPVLTPMLFAFAASGAYGALHPQIRTQMEGVTTSASVTTSSQKFVPISACPLTPLDMVLQSVQSALESIRNIPKPSLKSRPTTRTVLQTLESSGDETKATLTLTGYKGGTPEEQINQDRAFVIAPFMTDNVKSSLEQTKSINTQDDIYARRLMGVFDGHATSGEKVSEYCVTELPKRLAQKLSERMTLEKQDPQQQDAIVIQALHETFLELDQQAPDADHGGCTASIMLQLGKKLYFANAGDSRTFLCVHQPQSKLTEVVYITREDKPSLPEERRRVQRMGGKVWNPIGGGEPSRVLFLDPLTGDETGIAVSRSIGDRDVGKYGVIPDPTIHVIDLEELIQQRVTKQQNSSTWMSMISKSPTKPNPVDDVHIFAVSASDGMMDILNPTGVARYLVPSLCHTQGEHLLTACETLIKTASDGWTHASPDGKYRDDIAISVMKLRTPVPSTGCSK
jgi:serine/threonine protein phosphatase PrpC